MSSSCPHRKQKIVVKKKRYVESSSSINGLSLRFFWEMGVKSGWFANMNIKWFSIISGVLLLLGMLNGWPYGYYTILRWVVCGTAIFNTVGFSKSKLTGWVLVFGALAFLFNPLFPVYLNKSTWVGIDLISAVVFFLAANSAKSYVDNN